MTDTSKRHIRLQAITTKYLGPTNVRGSRIKASCAARSLTVGYNCALNSEEMHAFAAKALANAMGWRAAWFSGGMPDDKGDVFIQADYALAPYATFATEGDYA